MANIQPRRDKDGKLISYSIRVHRGRGADGKQLKPYTATFNVAPTWTESSAQKKATAFAAVFEKQCRDGLANDTRQTFQEYCNYVISLKESRGTKHSTIFLYRNLVSRIYPVIGHIKISDLRPDMLNDFYTKLSQPGENKLTGGKLATKTVLEHHRLISTVLGQAVKEGLIPFNPAQRVELPKQEHKEVNYFQLEDVAAIRDALEEEPLKWKMVTHLLLVSGARRGEILGLKWDKVDFTNNRIYICNNLLYTPTRGIYEESPKTASSRRYISLPKETMELLQSHKENQLAEQLAFDSRWTNQSFLFTQPDGSPMHPDSVTTWLKRFSIRHKLPHINPHAFRHTMASVLYFNGVDSVSISKRLGHAQVSTTANIYAHVMEEADQNNADIIEDIFLAKHPS